MRPQNLPLRFPRSRSSPPWAKTTGLVRAANRAGCRQAAPTPPSLPNGAFALTMPICPLGLRKLRLGRIDQPMRMALRNERDHCKDTLPIACKAGVDVRAVRRARGMTQKAFAEAFGFTVGALRDWEQGRKRPERSARILLAVIESEPDVVTRAVAAAGPATAG